MIVCRNCGGPKFYEFVYPAEVVVIVNCSECVGGQHEQLRDYLNGELED